MLTCIGESSSNPNVICPVIVLESAATINRSTSFSIRRRERYVSVRTFPDPQAGRGVQKGGAVGKRHGGLRRLSPFAGRECSQDIQKDLLPRRTVQTDTVLELHIQEPSARDRRRIRRMPKVHKVGKRIPRPYCPGRYPGDARFRQVVRQEVFPR